MGNWQLPPWAKMVDEAIVYDGKGEFWFYIPELYFNTKMAFFVGNYANIIGILDYTLVDDKGKNNGLHQFYFPSVFLSQPYTTETLHNVKLIKTDKASDYRVLKYRKGDKIVVSTQVPQDVAFVESLFKMALIQGNLPKTVRYDNLQDFFLDAIAINDNNYGITCQTIGLILQAICRDRNNIEKPFRNTDMKDMKDFNTISIKFYPKLISPYQSLISENTDESLCGTLLTSEKSDKDLPELPLEKVMTK